MTLEQARTSVATCFVCRGMPMKVLTATRGEIGNPHSFEVYLCESPDGIERFAGWLPEMPVEVRLAYTMRFIQNELPFLKLAFASSLEFTSRKSVRDGL